ncbi:glycogen synthase [Candidatus Magnetobacterium bavaricum]|uniref:Glycogen synthase n=1 Tax=Candidatus Magnetobacterium bavaricum TaxID=29290 RepID=A0A0F3GL00_9BACT|nr:glycogen synthase [Candidatus Magnetobacterium bavaricum]
MSKKLNILMVASEMVPFAKEGGLADVVGSLAKELVSLGHDVRVVIPRYKTIEHQGVNMTLAAGHVPVSMGVIGEMACAIWQVPIVDAAVGGIVYTVEHHDYFSREGGFYSNINGDGYMDNDNRFVFLSRAALELCKHVGFSPDCIHVHDWHTAAIPVLINTDYRDEPMLGNSATLLTIHNLQHQGEFYEGLMDVLGIGWDHFNYMELEKDGNTDLLKGGIYHATIVNTVSEGYARQIQTPEFGFGLDGVLRDRASDLYGIINGVDYSEWNPQTDKLIAANYSVDDLTGKALCKADLQTRLGLPVRPDVPVIGLITRLVKQKGIDVLAEAIYRLMELDVQIALLGTGEVWANFYFGDLPRQYPDKFGCYIGYDNSLAHKIEAGADFFLMPSSFEPCGLNQMYSLCYGSLPIVRAVGGLDDTVDNLNVEANTGTGFKFHDLTAGALADTVGWAVYMYYNQKDTMAGLIRRAMAKRFSWTDVAGKYVALYERAISKRRGL